MIPQAFCSTWSGVGISLGEPYNGTVLNMTIWDVGQLVNSLPETRTSGSSLNIPPTTYLGGFLKWGVPPFYHPFQ